MARGVEYLIEAAGIERLRITGGEPLVTPKFEPFLQAVSALKLKDISLTTNGQLLAKKLPIIIDNGVRRLNVSLDTLDAEAFPVLARGGDLKTVLAGLEEARQAGLKIKVNMVPLRGQNLDQILPLLEYCLERGFELRFIELMRMGHLARDPNGFQQQFVRLAELLEIIGAVHPFVQADAPVDATSALLRMKAYLSAVAVRVYACLQQVGCMAACHPVIATLLVICWTSPVI
jgi:cyclic pyranopterin phosphate synthase